ncbi:MAG: TolC family protein [Elusimicrobia bacterium]|nr:TolC family protein [Elusimicrobiota bacterium]
MIRHWTVLLFVAANARAQSPSASAPPPEVVRILEDPQSVPQRSITLSEAYALALKRSEEIAQREETYNEAVARLDEIKAAVRPHFSLTGSQTWQESPNIPGSPLNTTSVSQAQFVATQPIFSGFRDYLAYKSGKRRAEAASLDEGRAKSLLYQDVARAYLSLLQAQRDISIRASVLQATEDRIKELERRTRIGKSRESEAIAARSQFAQTQAQVEIARGQETVAQEAVRFLSGINDRLIPQELPVATLEPIRPILEKSRRRSDIEARRKDLEYAQLSTTMSRRQRWPVVGFTGDYYLKRPGFNKNSHWDAILSGSLPLWDGGTIGAQVRQSEAVQRSREQSVSIAVRTAEREVLSAYRTLGWTLAASAALRKAAELAQANVRAQTEDYRNSLVTNLEVLDGIAALQNTRLLLNQTEIQAALSKIQLDVAAGGPEKP